MTISKTPNGRFRVRVKSGRDVVASKTFDLKRDAQEWEAQQKRALTLGDFVDPRKGRESLGEALERWMEARSGTIAAKTLNVEGYALKRLSPALRNRPVSAVRTADLEAHYGVMLQELARPTVMRFRNILSSFYGWAVREGMVAKNPVIPSRVPRGTGEDVKHDVWPFSLAELRALHADITERAGADHADIALVLGLTGLRWGELAALRVRDVQLVPYPAFRVSRSRPDGQPVRVTKSGKVRTVPLAADLIPLIEPRITGMDPNAPVFPDAKGGMRLNSNWKRATRWTEVSRGRRVHDLRHTAATLWLQMGVDLKTVQAWLGHSSAKLTADTYAHWMGTDADAAAIARVNASLGDAGGTPVRKLRSHS